jgi:hypothetical protein
MAVAEGSAGDPGDNTEDRSKPIVALRASSVKPVTALNG